MHHAPGRGWYGDPMRPMKLSGAVAVVTGAGSGIGRSLAHRWHQLGMRVVVADVDPARADSVASEIVAEGGEALAIPTDVADYDSVENLCRRSFDRLGAVHVVCNNAGVIDMCDRPLWETPVRELAWVTGVNYWGVVYGMHAFLPRLLAQGEAAHIVNTASIAGVLSDGHYGIYNTTKHAVVAASETVHLALAERSSEVGVSVLCPGFTTTDLVHSDRSRPGAFDDDPATQAAKRERIDEMTAVLSEGMSPASVAEAVSDAVVARKFYVFPDDSFRDDIETRMRNVLEQRNP